MIENYPKGVKGGEQRPVDKAKIRLAEGWLDKASKHLLVASEHLKSYSNSSEAIEAAQECIELSVKAIFSLLDIKYPLRHGMQPDRKEFADVARDLRLLQSEFDAQGLGHIRLPRLFFLLNFWAYFYTISKYGYEVESLASARDLFDKKEAELAVSHAEECLRAAQELRFVREDKMAGLLAVRKSPPC